MSAANEGAARSASQDPNSARRTPARIARLVTRVSFGGAERNACLLTSLMDRRRFESTLIVGKPEPNEKENLALLERYRVTPVYIKGLRRAVGPWDLPALVRVGRTLQAIGPQLIHTHHSKVGLLARLSALQRFPARQRPRLVHTFHGHVLDGYFNPAVNAAFRSIERWLARRTDVILTVSEQLRVELAQKYRIAPLEKIRVIRLGVIMDWTANLELHRGWLRHRLGAQPGAVIIGMVGRLTRVKNPALGLGAFARWRRESHADAWLVLFGDGELRASLEKLAQDLGVADRVFFAGLESNTAKIFCDLDVTLLTSVNEGTPVSIIESLVAGVPAICTRVGGVPDVMSEPTDGEIVSSGDEDAVARAIAALAGRLGPLRPDRVAQVRALYSIPGMVKNVEALYDELLGDCSGPGGLTA